MRAPTFVSYRRHALLVRVTHWLNAGLFLVMLMTGLQIFNAHPGLYIGKASDFDHPVLEISAEKGDRGVTKVFGREFTTTGVLGLSQSANGSKVERAFPAWATLPGPQSLADGRRLHFFCAWALVINAAIYWLYGLISRRLYRDMLPTGAELAGIGRTAIEHLKLHFAHGPEALRYNVLQQLTYILVIAVLFPLLVLSGLTMSPRFDAEWPWLLDFFGGRQTARSVHFLVAASLVAFVLVHVVMVLLSGAWNNIRSMITGRYVVSAESGKDA